MNNIEELRNFVDNLKIKNQVKNDTLKRYDLLINKLKKENEKLKQETKILNNIIKDVNRDEELLKDVIKEIRVN